MLLCLGQVPPVPLCVSTGLTGFLAASLLAWPQEPPHGGRPSLLWPSPWSSLETAAKTTVRSAFRALTVLHAPLFYFLAHYVHIADLLHLSQCFFDISGLCGSYADGFQPGTVNLSQFAYKVKKTHELQLSSFFFLLLWLVNFIIWASLCKLHLRTRN